jgi:hypothetical protein
MPFKNIARLDNDGLSNVLEINLKYWFNDAFLRIGGIIPPRTSTLFPDTSKGAANLMVWTSDIQNWAHCIIENNKIIVTPATVTVNGVTQHDVTINYSKGQVTFTKELLPNDKVEARHYTNRVNIFNVLELNRRPMIRLESGTTTENHEDYASFQELAVSETIRTPYIIIETFPTGSADPIELGSGRVWATRRIQLNVVTESVGELSKILDILGVQSFRDVYLFDTNKTAREGLLPIDPLTGDINRSPNALQYPELIRQYRISSMHWNSISVRKYKTNKEDIHMGIAYFTVNIASNPNL